MTKSLKQSYTSDVNITLLHKTFFIAKTLKTESQRINLSLIDCIWFYFVKRILTKKYIV